MPWNRFSIHIIFIPGRALRWVCTLLLLASMLPWLWGELRRTCGFLAFCWNHGRWTRDSGEALLVIQLADLLTEVEASKFTICKMLSSYCKSKYGSCFRHKSAGGSGGSMGNSGYSVFEAPVCWRATVLLTISRLLRDNHWPLEEADLEFRVA